MHRRIEESLRNVVKVIMCIMGYGMCRVDVCLDFNQIGEEDVRKDGKIFNFFKNCTKCALQTEDN